MLRKAVWGLLLLAGLTLVGGCQAGEPTVPSISRPTAIGAPAPTPTPCDDCPDEGQPTATDTPTPALPPAPLPGHPAPNFALPDLAGNELHLGDLRGQAVLVNFWATW